MKTGYYKVTPIKSVDGYEPNKSYKVVIQPTHTGKLCVFKSVMSAYSSGVEFPDHMGYIALKDEQEVREYFKVESL